MKTIYIKLIFVYMVLGTAFAHAQSSLPSMIEGGKAFNEKEILQEFLLHHSNQPALFQEYLTAKKHDHTKHLDPTSEKHFLPPPTVQAACTNMDFESGDLTGWTASTGYNPLYDPQGCCFTAGGAQLITGGTGVDPCGGFPVVCPGGNFSVMIGDNGVGGIADRLEQTFTVTQANANYTYRYAVVLEDPGHTTAEQPSFQIDMLDSSGIQIPCTFYQVSAGQGIPGFFNSTNCANVVYKPWSTVSVDLSAYIGQDVTIRFTTFDCSLGGHYAYAYVDGSCVAYTITISDTLCVGGTTDICAPPGFQTYTWSGPGIVSQNNNCATINTPGNYSVQLTTVTGCNTPVINYQVNNYPAPVANFGVIGGNNACNLTVAFNNNSNNNGNNNQQLNFLWDFGDGTSSFSEQPTHTYLSQGTYTVVLIATNPVTGCTDTTQQVVTIDFPPTPLFSTAGVCAGSLIQFTNQSQQITGNQNWLWNFGDNTTATSVNATHIFAIAGTYNVTLTLTNNNGCTSNVTNAVTISPLPVANFVSDIVCESYPTNFSSTSTISSGVILTWQWDFNADGNTDNNLINPSYTLAGSGQHNIQLTVISGDGCTATISNIATVNPNPTAAFSTANVCQNAFATFQNTSTVALPSQIVQNSWNFGDNTSSFSLNPQHNFAAAGTYQISLEVTTDDGCIGTFSAPITIYPIPVTSFASTNVCLTQTTQFSDQSTVPGGTIASRAWDFNNDGIVDATIANPTHVYPSSGNQNAKLETISNNGCYNQVINQVSVYSNPIVSFTAESECLGNAVTFNNQSSSLDGSITNFSWDFQSDGSVDNISSAPSYMYTNFGTYLVTLEVQTQYGCEANYQSTVRINPNPAVQFSMPTNAGCPSLCINFSNNSTIASGSISSFVWDFGDQSIPSTDIQASHCYETGIYNVSLTAISDSGCISSYSSGGSVTVYASPTADFSISGDDVDIINPEVSISDQSTGASTLDYYISDGYTTALNDFTYMFNNEQPQTYTISQVVENLNGCKDTVNKTIEIKPAFTFYIPNAFSPNNDDINDGFKGQGMGIEQYRMWIFDRWGNMIFYSEDLDKAWDGSFQGKSGKTVMQDVYVWKVELKDIFNKSHNYNGTVAVVK